MKNLYNAVRTILLENEATRDDDMLLYGAFCLKHNLILPNTDFYSVMANAKTWGIPSYESVTRARRKVQELEPMLRGKNRNRRMAEEQKYREFYRR